MMKTIERAHTPRKLWEKVKLSKSYAAALEQIDRHLTFWPKFLVHKNKQRLTKITQYLIRCRKMAKQIRPELITMPAKLEKREARREVKAEVAARLEASIESELLARLKSGTYNEIYNFPTKEYAKVLDANAEADEEADEDGEEEDEEEEAEEVEYVEGYEDLEDEARRAGARRLRRRPLTSSSPPQEEDMEDMGFGKLREEGEGARGAKRGAARKRGREYEYEREEERSRAAF